MSVLVCAAYEGSAVIASDGLAMKLENNSLTPLQCDYRKFSVLSNEVVVGVTGSLSKMAKIHEFATDFAKSHRDNPQLLSLLKFEFPNFIHRLNEYPDPDFPGIGPMGAEVLLVGVGPKRMEVFTWRTRMNTSWTNQYPSGQGSSLVVLGYPGAVAFALKKAKENLLLHHPNKIISGVTELIEQAKETVPYVGGQTFTHVILKQQDKTNSV